MSKNTFISLISYMIIPQVIIIKYNNHHHYIYVNIYMRYMCKNVYMYALLSSIMGINKIIKSKSGVFYLFIKCAGD